jgi:hypothetical protein
MSRQRLIYPELFTSPSFMTLRIEARLLWIGLFTTADDWGRGRASPQALAGTIFPGDVCRLEDVESWIAQILASGLVELYEVGGCRYYQIPTWSKYQNPKFKAKSRIPAPLENDVVPCAEPCVDPCVDPCVTVCVTKCASVEKSRVEKSNTSPPYPPKGEGGGVASQNGNDGNDGNLFGLSDRALARHRRRGLTDDREAAWRVLQREVTHRREKLKILNVCGYLKTLLEQNPDPEVHGFEWLPGELARHRESVERRALIERVRAMAGKVFAGRAGSWLVENGSIVSVSDSSQRVDFEDLSVGELSRIASAGPPSRANGSDGDLVRIGKENAMAGQAGPFVEDSK